MDSPKVAILNIGSTAKFDPAVATTIINDALSEICSGIWMAIVRVDFFTIGNENYVMICYAKRC